MRRMMFILAGAVVMAASLFGAPINVVEGGNDFPAAGGPGFVLGIGVNTISGIVSGCPSCGGDYQDNFTVTLPVGLKFVSGSVSGSIAAGNANGTQSPACFTGQGCFYVYTTDPSFFFSGFSNPFGGSADWNFTAGSPYTTLTTDIAGASNYTVTITVDSAVPEPSTALLVVPAMAGIAWLRRRRRS